jgi:hypothetical protein
MLGGLTGCAGLFASAFTGELSLIIICTGVVAGIVNFRNTLFLYYRCCFVLNSVSAGDRGVTCTFQYRP